MNIMTKLMPLVVLSTLSSLISPALSASDSARIVARSHQGIKVSVVKSTNNQLDYCVSDGRGHEQCLLVDNRVSTQSNMDSNKGSQIYLSVASDSIDAVITQLNSSGFFSSVEQDIPVSGYGRVVGADNSSSDQSREQSWYYEAFDWTTYLGLGIRLMRSKIEASTKVTPIYVLDSGFYLNKGLHYNSGYNFVYDEEDIRHDLFTEDTHNEGYCIDHGVGVASVIVGFEDGGHGAEGVVSAYPLHAFRVMNCNKGFLSASSEAIAWIVGEKNLLPSHITLPDSNYKPGVINLSLGGKSECPIFMQDAVDAAIRAGFVVVVAAGNDNINIDDFAPANCEGVITVSATDDKAKKANFSNYGDGVTVSSSGVEIVGACNSGKYCFWEGTSLSAPLVSGMIAAVMAEFDLTNQEVKQILPWSTQWITHCLTENHCGYGQLDAISLYNNAHDLRHGKGANILPAESRFSVRASWVNEHLAPLNAVDFCGKESINIPMPSSTMLNIRYKIGELARHLSVLENEPSYIGSTQTGRFLFSGDVAANRYYYQTCLDGNCDNEWFVIDDTDWHITTPCSDKI